jgi:hypothetical protein
MTDFTYVISEDEDNHLVNLVVNGSLNKNEGEKVIKETRELATEKQCGILCDITNATFNVTMADWFFLARNKDVFPSVSTEKTAILINPGNWKLFKYVEDVTQNVGMKIRVFRKKEDAMAWLKKVG